MSPKATLEMAGFSGALKLTDLDDFITPSQVGSNVIQPTTLDCTAGVLKYTLDVGFTDGDPR